MVTVTKGICEKAGRKEIYRDLRNSRLGDMAYLPQETIKRSRILSSSTDATLLND